MENVIEKVSRKTSPKTQKTVSKTSGKTTTRPDCPGVEFDENGRPIGCTIVELMDELDQKFVNFYGEYGRQMVNARRERWNQDGLWHFEMF